MSATPLSFVLVGHGPADTDSDANNMEDKNIDEAGDDTNRKNEKLLKCLWTQLTRYLQITNPKLSLN